MADYVPHPKGPLYCPFCNHAQPLVVKAKCDHCGRVLPKAHEPLNCRLAESPSQFEKFLAQWESKLRRIQ